MSTEETTTLRTRAADARRWLFEDAAPLWSGRGLHADGMFAEALTPEGEPVPGMRRLRVQARQIYAFSQIGRLGWDGPWADAANGAADVLLARGRRPDGFFIHLFDGNGEPCDPRADLYDSACVIFAFAHAGRALDRPDLLAAGRELMDAIVAHWSRPTGGYGEGEVDPQPPRRQNPHMHLLEACIAHWEITGDVFWRDHVAALAALARDRFVDPGSGALLGYFGPDWSRLDSESGRSVEPGHCFEWAWLFERVADLGLGDPAPSDGLAAFARRHGVIEGGNHAVNEVDLDGALTDAAARLWPQAERLKAALARWRRVGGHGEIVEAIAAYDGLRRYLDTPVRGSWQDRLLPGGRWETVNAPGSSLYHITVALSELFETAARMA